MNLQNALVGGSPHPMHDKQLCDYADAAAKEMYDEVMKQLPDMIEKAIHQYLKTHPSAVEVDKASLANVKSQIMGIFRSIFK